MLILTVNEFSISQQKFVIENKWKFETAFSMSFCWKHCVSYCHMFQSQHQTLQIKMNDSENFHLSSAIWSEHMNTHCRSNVLFSHKNV